VNGYVDKLELDDKNDEDLLKSEKQEILDFKNYQIQKLKAFITSLELEKQDLIENYRNTTSTLLERLKDLEQKQLMMEERPQTAFIIDKMQKSKNKINIEKGANDKKINVYNFENDTEYNIDVNDNQNKENLKRCPNCQKFF